MVNDPVADLIARLKNAGAVGHKQVSLPYSRLKEAIALTLKKAGFVGEVARDGDGAKKALTIELKYGKDGTPAIRGAKRLSKPGRRLYAGVRDIHPVKYGKGIMVLSTPRGILVDAEARKTKTGGETLFTMW
ncbi:MAG: 30S ribosomal protein S8 [Candidatus Paceibacteria bacterium]